MHKDIRFKGFRGGGMASETHRGSNNTTDKPPHRKQLTEEIAIEWEGPSMNERM